MCYVNTHQRVNQLNGKQDVICTYKSSSSSAADDFHIHIRVKTFDTCTQSLGMFQIHFTSVVTVDINFLSSGVFFCVESCFWIIMNRK